MNKKQRENPFKYTAIMYICVLIASLMAFMLKLGWMIAFLLVAVYFKYKESQVKWVKGW